MARETCPDCNGAIAPINVINGNPWKYHWELQYSDSPGEMTYLGGKVYKSNGLIKGYVCADCGRILLYAEPKKPLGSKG